MERKVRAENDKSDTARKCRLLSRMLTQLEDYGVVNDEPGSDLGIGFILDSKEENSEQSIANESGKPQMVVSADFVERLRNLVAMLEEDSAHEVTSWAKAHEKIALMEESPDWVEMITPNALGRSIRDGIKRFKQWSSWPSEYQGFKRTRPLLLEVWNEYWEK